MECHVGILGPQLSAKPRHFSKLDVLVLSFETKRFTATYFKIKLPNMRARVTPFCKKMPYEKYGKSKDALTSSRIIVKTRTLMKHKVV